MIMEPKPDDPPGSSPEDVAAWILETREESRLGSDLLKVTMDLPPAREVRTEVLADALAYVFREFRVQIPKEVLREIRENRAAAFTFSAPASDVDLRPRTVLLDCSAEARLLNILGESPLDGLDGSLQILFDYQTRPGRLSDDGTIDFRQVNRFPQARTGDCLLKILAPTDGLAGTDVYGMPVRPKPGQPRALEIGEGIAVESGGDEESGRETLDLMAVKAGIIISEFQGEVKAVETLRSVAVQNTIVVGDVDFSTGNLGDARQEIRCVADVVVKGDIRGRFSAMIEGSLEVKGAVEGEAVDVSGSLTASFVRSSVQAGKTIQVAAALNAQLQAVEAIAASRELINSHLCAKEVLVRPHGTPEVLCGQLTIAAHRVSMTGISFRNFVDVDLGPDLFLQLRKLDEREGQLLHAKEVAAQELKDRVTVLVERLKIALNTTMPEHMEGVRDLRKLVASFLNGSVGPLEASDQTSAWMERHGRHLHSLGKRVIAVVGILQQQAQRDEELDAICEQRQAVRDALGGLEARIAGTLLESGRLLIRCGKEEMEWQPPPGRKSEQIGVSVRYVPGQGLVKKG